MSWKDWKTREEFKYSQRPHERRSREIDWKSYWTETVTWTNLWDNRSQIQEFWMHSKRSGKKDDASESSLIYHFR